MAEYLWHFYTDEECLFPQTPGVQPLSVKASWSGSATKCSVVHGQRCRNPNCLCPYAGISRGKKVQNLPASRSSSELRAHQMAQKLRGAGFTPHKKSTPSPFDMWDIFASPPSRCQELFPGLLAIRLSRILRISFGFSVVRIFWMYCSCGTAVLPLRLVSLREGRSKSSCWSALVLVPLGDTPPGPGV